MTLFRRSVLTLTAIVGLAACSSSGGKQATNSSTSTSTSATAAAAAAAANAAPGSCASSTSAVAGSKRGVDVAPPGDIPDDQAFVAYSSLDNLYTVKVPEGWARAESPSAVTFTDKLNAIDIRAVDAPAAPAIDSAKTDEVPKLAASTTCFELRNVTTVTRKAGPAVLIAYRADSPADPVTGKVLRDDIERYELWRNGKEVILTLSAPVGSDNVDPWRTVTDSFTWR